MFPYVRNDTTLYFSSNGHPGMGIDLLVAYDRPMDSGGGAKHGFAD